jgi:hypothetical protein
MYNEPNITYTDVNKFESSHEAFAYLEIDLDYPKILRDKFPIQRLTFSNLPTEISDSGADPVWNEISIMGRYSPYMVYGGTSVNDISFTLQFYATGNPVSDVKQKVDWLRSMKYPVLHENISYRPPTLIFYWGNLIRRRVVLKSAQPVYRSPWYVEDISDIAVVYPLHAMIAEVSVILAVVENEFISGPDVMRGTR